VEFERTKLLQRLSRLTGSVLFALPAGAPEISGPRGFIVRIDIRVGQASSIHNRPIGTEGINMSNSNNSPNEAAAPVLIDPVMLTPEQVIEQLRIMRQQIPNFVQLPNNRETDAMRRLSRAISLEFAHEATNAVGVSSVVEGAVGNTAEGMYQDKDIAGRWAAAENEMRSVLRGLSSTNLVMRQRLCRDALQAFNISRELVKQPEHAHLLSHVEAMRRLKRSRRRVKPATEPAPNPVLVTKTSE
jgi:hypothetical protein